VVTSLEEKRKHWCVGRKVTVGTVNAERCKERLGRPSWPTHQPNEHGLSVSDARSAASTASPHASSLWPRVVDSAELLSTAWTQPTFRLLEVNFAAEKLTAIVCVFFFLLCRYSSRVDELCVCVFWGQLTIMQGMTVTRRLVQERVERENRFCCVVTHPSSRTTSVTAQIELQPNTLFFCLCLGFFFVQATDL
jgi:hypothetical protein